MLYQVSRNGQTYGPYTLEDLQRYLASGNVLPSDLAKNEDMQNWVPVSEIVAGMAAAATPPASPFATPAYADVATGSAFDAPVVATSSVGATSTYPDAPNLHWGIYLLLAILTCGLFSKVFTCVQAAWLKRVQPNSTALAFYLGTYALWLFNALRSGVNSAAIFGAAMRHQSLSGYRGHTGWGLGLVYWVLLFTTRIITMNSLQEHFNTAEPIGLRLNPVLAFLFGGVYFQSELNLIHERKQAARYGAVSSY